MFSRRAAPISSASIFARALISKATKINTQPIITVTSTRVFSTSNDANDNTKIWKVYLSGEIHSDWREVIAEGVDRLNQSSRVAIGPQYQP